MTKKPLFYKIYFSVIAGFLVLLAAGLCLLYAWLNEYEKAQPDKVIDKIYSEYLKKGDLYGLRELCETDFSCYETKETVNKAYSEMLGGKRPKLQSRSQRLDTEKRSYSLLVGDTELLTLTLKKQKSGGRLGVKGYALSSVSISESYSKTVKITAPEYAEITVNGVSLKKESAKKNELPKILQGIEGSESFEVLQSYELKNLLNKSPEIKAKKGDKELVVEENEGSYSVLQAVDEAKKKEVQGIALEAAKAYAAYMQDDASFGQVSKYLDPNTDFYESVKTTPAYFAWDHNGHSFKNVRFGATYCYSEDIWRCRVLFTQELYLKATTYTDPFDKYVYLRCTDDGWRVIDMLTGEE